MDLLLKHNIEKKSIYTGQALCGDISRREFIAALSAIALVGPQLKAAPKNGDVIVVRGGQFDSSLRATENAQNIINSAIARLSGLKKGERALDKLLPTDKKYSVKIDCVSPLARVRTPVIEAILADIFDRGVQPWDVSIWDARISDVRSAGYHIKTRHGIREVVAAKMSNKDDGGEFSEETFSLVVADKSDDEENSGKINQSVDARLAKMIGDGSPAIINLPSLRHHSIAGFTGALASLALGSINDSGQFQSDVESFTSAVVNTWKQPAFSGHLLSVLDAGSVVFEGGPVGLPAWTAEENTLIIGFDPVAVDAAAMQIFERIRAERGMPSLAEPVSKLLKASEEAGLGNMNPNIINLNAEQL